ncbi:hypothetical protein CCHR01_06960 [Colletotrichum chrysophilum]|uniref:Uncharacterized protein n=1 Tax=Colletotrichum chrysophilum TaxID=1836956 RepID=A0AAD9EJA4_9PEZI|nr:hypothetical protein CCHR01_06960 [Colletotrichum chrysophilum]
MSRDAKGLVTILSRDITMSRDAKGLSVSAQLHSGDCPARVSSFAHRQSTPASTADIDNRTIRQAPSGGYRALPRFACNYRVQRTALPNRAPDIDPPAPRPSGILFGEGPFFLAIEDSTLASLPTVLPPRRSPALWGRAVSSILTSPILPSFQQKAVSSPGAGSLQGEGGAASGRSSSWFTKAKLLLGGPSGHFALGTPVLISIALGEESSLMVPLEMPPHRV